MGPLAMGRERRASSRASSGAQKEEATPRARVPSSVTDRGYDGRFVSFASRAQGRHPFQAPVEAIAPL
eukprot:15435967-Alexandrium_andersonii.AAC.1